MNTTHISCELVKAELSVMAELALIKLGLPEQENDGFSGYIVEGYEFAFLELEAVTPLQKNIVDNVKNLMVKTKEFIDGYNRALSNMQTLNNF
jgi:hypothetical protein